MELKKQELLELFEACIDNSMSLFKSANELVKNKELSSPASLGLAEFALEELGKSYMCLAYYGRDKNSVDWKNFWKEWKGHDLKAHRAFFYEFFCLLRVDIDDPLYRIPTRRVKFSLEKEAAFYVDIDKGNRKIHIPKKEIDSKECYYRVFSLVGPLNAALKIKESLKEPDEFFRQALSDHAYNFLINEPYQQDVNNELEKMKGENNSYNMGVQFIYKLFNAGAV
jgi:AbiV family abortive infection protein